MGKGSADDLSDIPNASNATAAATSRGDNGNV